MLGVLGNCQVRSAGPTIDRNIVEATIGAEENRGDIANRTRLLQFAKIALFQIAANINMTRDPRAKCAYAVHEQIGACDHFQDSLHGAFPEHCHLGLQMIKESRDMYKMNTYSLVPREAATNIDDG